jgi:hypothetical protein
MECGDLSPLLSNLLDHWKKPAAFTLYLEMVLHVFQSGDLSPHSILLPQARKVCGTKK